MKITTGWLILSAAILGILAGVLWLGILLGGVMPDTPLFFYIAPAVFSVIISIILLFLDTESSQGRKIFNSILFLILSYIFQLVPLAVWILFIFLSGGFVGGFQ